MHFTSPLLASIFAVPFSLAAPTAKGYNLPLLDNLPYPSPQELRRIQLRAHGTLPTLALPANASATGITNLQLIAFTEFAQVAFYDELLYNLTNEVEGFEIEKDDEKEFILRSLSTILAQEEVHALTANDALKSFGRNPIQPCHYEFPVSKLDEAIDFAATFTSHYIGGLQDITQRFAANGDTYFSQLTASLIDNKGEQEGWLRVYLDKYPSKTPFLTPSEVNFLFTAVQNYVVPGSCPNIAELNLTTFKPLGILTPPDNQTQKIKISWTHPENEPLDTLLWLTYVNQLNMPVVLPLQVISCDGETAVAVALFPYDEYSLNGLTIAALVNRNGMFANVAAVANATVYGPGLITVN